MAGDSGLRLCRLQGMLGRVETCPEAACPFWESGGTTLAGHCAIDELDLAGHPEVADWLLRIRGQLETVGTREEEDEARQQLYRLLATGDADGG